MEPHSSTMAEKIRLLVTVKTYPLLSISYMETVCTAGVREDGSFIRLYPIEYRYRASSERYKKYQWIEVEVVRPRGDPRPESYSPAPGSKIRALGGPLPTKDGWAERKRYVLAKGTQTMCALEKLSGQECSLGIIRPKEVEDFIAEPADRDWKPVLMSDLYQLKLFDVERKPLEKIPYKFSYVFKCEDPSCKGHKKMIEDWEVGQLYRRMRDEFRSEERAIEKVKERFLGDVCASDRETHFFVGTTLAYGTWIILGAFWPPKRAEQFSFLE